MNSFNESFPSERATARIELQVLMNKVQQIENIKMESMDKVHFSNIEDLRFRHCFSLLQTWPKLFGDKRPLTMLSLDEKPKSKE